MREISGLNAEDKLLLAKTDDLVFLSNKTFQPKYSNFLDERQQLLASSYIKETGSDYVFWGGYENAERKILCVHSSEYDKPDYTDFPLKCIEFSYRKTDILTHRDFLGSIMACMIKREAVGDIAIDENNGKAKVLVLETVAGLLLEEIRKIGSVGVKSKIDEEFSITYERKFVEIFGTVSSLRIDSIVSIVTKQSREKASELIKKIGVEIWYKPIFSVSTILKEGDIFSVKGYGKFLLKEVNGVSKKGKLRIIIQKYV